MQKIKKGQKVYWIDPAGETFGEYEIYDANEKEYENLSEDDKEFEFADDRILLIGDGSSEAEVFLRELIFINATLPDEIKEKSRKFLEDYGREPMYAVCRITWLDDGSSYDVKIKLSVDVKQEADDEIFFYCDGLNDLKSLTTPGGEDFIVTDFYHFE